MNVRPDAMKVVIICHSDLFGGASVVSYRLMQALRREGVDARMLVYTKLTDDPYVELIGNRTARGLKFLAERARIMAANKFDRANLFKVSIANTGYAVERHPWVKRADAVILAWVNQGLMSLNGVRRLARTGKPVIWTMHDMWNLTGICHHAHSCTNYRGECGRCPFLHSDKPDDLSHTTWLKKKALYDSVPLRFVAVSNWLAERCAESTLLAGRQIEVIPNAFPVDSFFTSSDYRIEHFAIDYSRSIVLMGAARLDEPIKGLDYAIDALNYIFDNHPDVARKSQAVFFGDVRNPEIFDRLRFPYAWTGRINDPKLLRILYASGKVVVSSSLYETLPGTLIEGQAAGCLPVTFGRGGQADIITHMKDGYIADYLDSVSLAKGIIWALSQQPDRNALHESVRSRFSSAEVARRYIKLLKQMLN